MSLETALKVECIEKSDKYGRFIADPLEAGEGITVGNTLRRVLLSSLTGAAITWLRIEGVQHEFSAIPYVKEDTMEFLLNVKGIRLRSLSGRSGKVTLEVTGERKVTAADISPSNDFKIVNPDLYLAALDSPEAQLKVEFNVELGKGFTSASYTEGQPIGVVPVDSIFTPVRKVKYTVEPVNVSHGDGSERLILEVWTDGTILPTEAVARSAQIIMSRFASFAEMIKEGEITEEKPTKRAALPPDQYDLTLENLKFSVRTFNCLKRGSINTLGQLLEKSEEELMALRHFGEKSRQEVEEKLQLMGYVLPIKEVKDLLPVVSPENDIEMADIKESEEGRDNNEA